MFLFRLAMPYPHVCVAHLDSRRVVDDPVHDGVRWEGDGRHPFRGQEIYDEALGSPG